MRHSPAEILAKFLLGQTNPVAQDPTGNPDWSLFISETPDAPDQAITVYDTTGVPDGMIFETGVEVVHPGIEIRVRSNKYNEGYSKMKDIEDALSITGPQKVDFDDATYFIECIKLTSPITPIGFEPGTKRRLLFTLNQILTIRQGDPTMSQPNPTNIIPDVGYDNTQDLGTMVLITGSGFSPGALVKFGTVSATNIQYISSFLIACMTPPGDNGEVDVTVTNLDEGTGTLEDGFTFVAPPWVVGNTDGMKRVVKSKKNV